MSSEDLTGRTLGDFVVRHRIGEGGFGAVYRAEQAVLGREAVIKVLHGRHRSTKTVNQRFLREAQLASKLDHPYAAHIYAFGVETDGLMWIAMEYVRGKTLQDLLRERGPMPLEELVPLLDRICEVLQAAHDLGIIHRDIKPPNVMVVQRAGRAFPKLLDFGIAKLEIDEPERKPTVARIPEVSAVEATVSFVGEPGHGFAETLQTAAGVGRVTTSKEPVLTEAGTMVGSPPYMAPEQWVDSAAATSRTDLYALGVLTYEALTGRRPFTGATNFALALAHSREPVPRLGCALPAALDAVIGKVLAKNAGERYGSAMELAHAFRSAAGFGTQPLPVLDEDLRQVVEASFPQPIAEAVAAFHAARNAHQGRDALRDIATTAIRYLASIALAAQAQVSVEADNRAVIADAMRALRRRALTNAEWLNLARELAATMRARRDAHPMPELVALLEADGETGPLASVVKERTGDPDPLLAIVDLLPAITQMLRAIAFLADYPLVVVAEGRAESWMGVRRPRRVAIEVIGRAIETTQPTLVDVRGRPAVVLWPIVQASAPMPGAAPELFMLDGGGRRGARLVAMPNALERQDEAVWEWLSARFVEHDRVPSSALDTKPYRGLSAYTTQDADAFVGREREIDAAINRLSTSSLVAVVGPSGVGKSSFVHAGILPSLPAGTNVISLRPGTSPLAVLQQELERVGETSTVLVVDQFEELFTLGADHDERRAFARVLLAATQLRVILTLRDDFLARATQMPELRERLSASLFLLGTPTRAELVRILRQPLAQQGFDFDDPALPERMVDDVADTPGALALLSFTAGKLWDLRDRHFRQLTRKAYDALGGVAGALAQHAEATLANLSPHEQRLARTTLRHLLTADGTRAILTTRELDQLLRDPAAATVIEKLIAARLLVSTEAETGDDRIEIVHEALIAAWPRLETWRREDAEGARLRDQVRAAARQWIERDKPSGLLWRDDALAELKVWRVRHPQPLTDADEAFVAASLGDARRRTRVRRALVAIAIAITAVFLAITWRANVSAQRSARIADEATLDARAKLRDSLFEEGRLRMLDGDDQKALEPLEKAREMGEDGPGIRFMIAAAKRGLFGKLAVLHGHTARLWDVRFSPDGSRVATSSADGTVRVWTAAGALVATFDQGAAVTCISFSPDSKLLAGGGRGGKVQIWSIADRREVAAFAVKGRVLALEYSPDGTRILATSEEDPPIVFDVASRVSKKLPGHTISGSGTYCSGGSCLVTWDDHGHVAIWDARTLVEIRHYDLGQTLPAGAVDADGSLIVVGTAGGGLFFLRGDRPPIAIENAHANTVLAIAIKGDTVATASSDRTARLWDPNGKLVATLLGHRATIFDVRFSPTADIVATASADGSARLWGAHSGLLLGEAEGHTAMLNRLEFDRDGKRFATASSDHDAIVWDVEKSLQFHSLPVGRVDTVSPLPTIHYAPTGTILAMTEPASTIAIADAATGAVRCTTAIAGPVLAWSRDASTIASIDATEHVVRIWDARTCALVHELPAQGQLYALAFDHANALLTGGEQKVVRRWSTDGRLLATSPAYPGAVVWISVGDDGKTIATTYHTGNVVVADSDLSGPLQVYRAKTDQLLTGVWWDKSRHHILASGFEPYVWMWNEGNPDAVAKLEATGPLWNVLQTSSGTAIAIGGVTPSLWSTSTMQSLGLLEGHSDLVVGGVLTASGLLVTVSRDKTARVWDLDKRRAVLTIPGAQTVAIDASGTSLTFLDTTGSRSWSVPM